MDVSDQHHAAAAFTPRESTQLVGGRIGPRTDMNILDKGTFPFP